MSYMFIGSRFSRSYSSPIALVINYLFVLAIAGHTSTLTASQIDFQLKGKNLAYYKSTGVDSDVQATGNQGFARLDMPGPGPLTGELPRVAFLFDFTIISNTVFGDQTPWSDPDQPFSFAANLVLTIDVPTPTVVTTFDFAFPTFYFTDDLNAIPVNPDWLWVDSNNGEDTWIQMRLPSSTTGSEGYLAYATTDTSAAAEYAATGGDLFDGTTVIERGVGSISYTAVPEIGSVEFVGIGLSVFLAGYTLRRRPL